jgi:bla regulator protein blaR1
MHALLAIALKSVVISGLALVLLAVTKRRSSAERSWVAHIGLLALVTLAFAPLVLPSWSVEAPALFASPDHPATVAAAAPPATAAVTSGATPVAQPAVAASSVNWTMAATAAYAIPAAILLFITLLALGRLLTLRARADVLVDGHWLSALARAQRRMGFKHGTALLTSNELSSPISWGLMRPVILLNERAVQASGEAEAIIAHELAHVARLDWAKLLLARVATALFWFNPLVWLLAREAHQLREETADDAVLASDIADTDYAELLVGVARHECSGLLLGAHGVAPSRSSLARRVARVLDSASARGPVARPFALGVFVGAVAIAAPLTALTLTPSKPAAADRHTARMASGERTDTSTPYYTGSDAPQDLPHIIAQGVSTSVAGAVAAIRPTVAVGPKDSDFEAVSPSGASVKSVNGLMVARGASGATVTVYPPDANGRRKVVARGADGATAVSYEDADDEMDNRAGAASRETHNALQSAVEMKAVGMTPDYVAAMRASAPELRDADVDDLAGMKAVGVTPAYVHDLSAAGLRNFDSGDIAGARAVGVDGNYIRSMRAAGFGDADLGDLIGARAVGLTAAEVQQMRGAGYDGDLGDFTALRSMKDGRRGRPGPPPQPPAPPRPPGG